MALLAMVLIAVAPAGTALETRCTFAAARQTPPVGGETPSSTQLEALRADLREIRQDINRKKKDGWDRLAAVSPLFGGVLVAIIGGIATYIFNKRQREAEDARAQRALEAEDERKKHELAILRVQTLQAFLPELRSTDEPSKEAAVLAITSLGDTELMSRVVELFQGEGVVSALAKVATKAGGKAAAVAAISLQHVTDALETAVVAVRDDGHTRASGFVAAPGLVVTVDYATRTPSAGAVVSFSNGREEQAKVLRTDAGTHLAVLETDTGSVLPLPLTTDTSPLGATVLVLGYAGSTTERHTSIGEILGSIAAPDLSRDRLLLANIDTQPGFSGAPVVNTGGQVIGISHARKGNRAFLIPATSALNLLSVPDSPTVPPSTG